MAAPHYAPLFGSNQKNWKQYNYKGLRIKADEGVHEQVAAFIEELSKAGAGQVTSKKLRILDWGCGEGALTQRLYDLGHEVVGLDIDVDSFKAQGPQFYRIDFNLPGSLDAFVRENQIPFDVIVSTEVIEHIQNPWDFLRSIKKLCGLNTHVIITTPNVSCWWSRLKLFFTGRLYIFEPEHWVDPGHINPVMPTEMLGLLDDNGFECLHVYPAGILPIIWAYDAKRLIMSLAVLPFRPLMRGYKDGTTLMFHALLKQTQINEHE